MKKLYRADGFGFQNIRLNHIEHFLCTKLISFFPIQKMYMVEWDGSYGIKKWRVNLIGIERHSVVYIEEEVLKFEPQNANTKMTSLCDLYRV